MTNNREIKFRGFHIDENGKEKIFVNGEWVKGYWVYGYYTLLPVGSIAATIVANDNEIVCEDVADYIIRNYTKQHSNFSNAYPLQVFECDVIDVIPKTVGQYTGLKDKNGKEIFEGDIVHCVSQLDNADMVVSYEEGEFRMILCKKYKEYITGSGFYELQCFEKEVVGNIYENPELLGEVKE